jgi:hypothetical protein
VDILTFITDKAPDFIASSLYDLAKFVIGYVIARLIYERVFKRWQWGGWTLHVRRGDEVLARRDLSPEKAERIIKNDDELSVYVKGVVSPHAWLNMDIGSPRARECGLLVVDRKHRTLAVDLAHNPPKQAQGRHPARDDDEAQQPGAGSSAATSSGSEGEATTRRPAPSS